LSKGDSDTESDAGTDDEQFYEEDDAIFDLTNSAELAPQSTEEFLLSRRARIERMLKIYQAQHSRLKQTLQAKYQQFIKQRQQATNNILASKGIENQHASIKLRMKMADHRDEDVDPEQLTLQHLLEGVASFPQENRQVYQCSKEEKFDDVTGDALCSHPSCHAKRMMCSEFCFEHILYDENQRLYMAGPNGVGDPVLCYRMTNTIASAFAVHNEKKVVIIENTFPALEKDKPLTEAEEQKLTPALQKIKE
jgi:hypothetical protein